MENIFDNIEHYMEYLANIWQYLFQNFYDQSMIIRPSRPLRKRTEPSCPSPRQTRPIMQSQTCPTIPRMLIVNC